MSYRIDYPFTNTRFIPRPIRWGRIALYSAIFCIGILCAAAAYSDSYKLVIQEFLIPGDEAVTAAAFSTMLSELRAGTQPRDALTDFCREILSQAEIPLT